MLSHLRIYYFGSAQKHVQQYFIAFWSVNLVTVHIAGHTTSAETKFFK